MPTSKQNQLLLLMSDVSMITDAINTTKSGGLYQIPQTLLKVQVDNHVRDF